MASPPKKREVPRTSSKLDKMEPSREHFTTVILPSLRANSAMITSVTLPNVAFNSPPTAVQVDNYMTSKLYRLVRMI